MPAATSRWRRSGRSCGWTSRTTSGRSSSRWRSTSRSLFGVDIHEVQPYRPIPQQVAEVLALGRTMTIELDAWYLPDTAATSYEQAHVKTGVIAESIDLDGQRFRYFHNASLYELSRQGLPRRLPPRDRTGPTTSCRRTPS